MDSAEDAAARAEAVASEVGEIATMEVVSIGGAIAVVAAAVLAEVAVAARPDQAVKVTGDAQKPPAET